MSKDGTLFGTLRSSIKTASGVGELATLGTVYRGKYGYNDCSVQCYIETFEGAFLLRIEVDLTSGKSFKNVRSITWPYSQTSAEDLSAPLQDLRAISNALEHPDLEDTRTSIGRFFDKITGRKYIGEYLFRSLLTEPRPRTVRGIVVDSDEGPAITLIEKRKGAEGIHASMPLAAIPFVIDALQTWKQGSRS